MTNRVQPLVSIVTVVYNGEKYLEKTIQSVLNQTYKDIEYIIIDGGSTDGTLDIIKKYEERIDYWVSERDSGIYDAMNKGIDAASGEWINFMNAGDSFFDDNTLSDVVSNIKCLESAYFGRALVRSEKTSWLYPNININETNYDQWLSEELPNHQAIFFPKVFYKNNKYDLRYKIFSDTEYKQKVQEQCEYKFVDITICNFELGGVSSSFESYSKVIEMMIEAWHLRYHRGLVHYFKRVFIYNIKYIIRILLKDNFYKVIKKLKFSKGNK